MRTQAPIAISGPATRLKHSGKTKPTQVVRAIAAKVRKSAYAIRFRTSAEYLHKDAEALQEFSISYFKKLLTGNSRSREWPQSKEGPECSRGSQSGTNVESGLPCLCSAQEFIWVPVAQFWGFYFDWRDRHEHEFHGFWPL